EEETSFLKTLGKGLKMISKMISELQKGGTMILPGKVVFELYDTYGFPPDLTQLILKEKGLRADLQGFEEEMKNQKKRSRDDASQDTGDWVIVREKEKTLFTGYETTEDEILISKYRTIRLKDKEICQLVFDKTPFYAEAGGQVGDTGIIISKKDRIEIINTIKENNLIVHISKRVPSAPEAKFTARVDTEKRRMTASNHTATHLIHFALRSVLGKHVEQKGSLVTPEKLRFDFSHFSKLTKDELIKVEMMANSLVRGNHQQKMTDNVPLEEAQAMGALALFGEKYGETVRVVQFGDSIELCGGTHVNSTASIGLIKILSEGAIAAGVRRIEAVTAEKAEEYINEKITVVDEISSLLKNPANLRESIEKLIAENNSLKKDLEKFQAKIAMDTLRNLEKNSITINNIRFISGQIETDSAETLRTIAFMARKLPEDCIMVIGSEIGGKANLVVMVNDRLVKEKNINAVTIIKEIAGEINGSGGGQPFLATAGGKNPYGIGGALKKAEELVRKM
ncbi:MAG: alanine--tRNA ligase, partial [Bacteroidales bacterium]|nr:alanine--tRNA ligase [Bacteroidales bacterium]